MKASRSAIRRAFDLVDWVSVSTNNVIGFGLLLEDAIQAQEVATQVLEGRLSSLEE